MLERQNESFHIEWKKGRWRNRDSGIKGIKWNFTKFLVDRKGNVVARHGPQVKPEALAKDIEKLLAEAA